MKIKQEDIYYLVAQKLEIPEEQVEFIIKDLYYNLRFFLREQKKPILLNTFIKLTFNEKRFDSVIKKREERNAKDKTISQTNIKGFNDSND
jgi:hypothetical protein